MVSAFLAGLLVVNATRAAAQPTDNQKEIGSAIVFVPGVTGSRLEDSASGTVIWGDASQVFSPKDRGHSTVLPLEFRASANRPKADAVQATSVLSHLRMFGYTREIYRPLRRFLEGEGYSLGNMQQPKAAHDLYFFAYDWRRENQNAVEELHAALTRLAKARGNPNVRLLCQSNAGRICRYLAKFNDADPKRLLAADNLKEQLRNLLKPPPYTVEQLILISNSHGGALRQLHELHNGRKYVPGIGRFMGPEALFALRTLFEDLPLYRDDLFLDQEGAPVDADLFDPKTWLKYQWSVFDPAIEKTIAEKDPQGIFGTKEDRRRYLAEQLLQADRVNRLLMSDSPRFRSKLCLLQNTTVETYERALIVRDERRNRWRLLFAGDRGVPKKLEPLLASKGDGHGTVTSQNFLSGQELEATTAKHAVAGGHFDTITRKETLAKVKACLDE